MPTQALHAEPMSPTRIRESRRRARAIDEGAPELPQELDIASAHLEIPVRAGASWRRGDGPPARSMHPRLRPDRPSRHPRLVGAAF